MTLFSSGPLMFQAILRNMLVLLALVAGSITIAFASENRVALVIGNSAYRYAAVLDNPANDATDMAAAAEKLGFKVIKGLDLDKSGMDRTIRQFAESLRGASVGMFFYAGHGLQVGGRNYLVPIDAELKTAEALDFEMVGVDVVQRIMEAASETNILFVDACRDNPLSRNLARAMGTRSGAIGRGLVAQEAGAGTLISFSTQPGNVALDSAGSRNSPYAAALTKHIGTQGKDLPALLVQVRKDVMAATGKRQIPWEHSALTAEVMLSLQAPDQTSATAAPKAEASENKDGIRSESKTAETAAKPETIPKKAAVTIKPGIGTLSLTNAKTKQRVFGKDDKEYTSGYLEPGRSMQLPAGRYRLVDGVNGFTSVEQFDVRGSEVTDINFAKYTGILVLKNAKTKQRVYGENGKEYTSGYLEPNQSIELPIGRYRLVDGANGFVSVELFDIRGGEVTNLNLSEYVCLLTLKNAKTNQRVYGENDKEYTSGYLEPNHSMELPAGRYRLVDGVNGFVSAEKVEINADQETIIDFGG